MDLQLTPMMLVIALIMGSISAYLAYRRKKNPYLWFFLGFIFGIVGIFAVFLAQPKSPPVSESPPKPTLKIEGPTDKLWYYLDQAHKQMGPMSKDALTHALKEGKIGLSTYVWHEELIDWKPLKETVKSAP